MVCTDHNQAKNYLSFHTDFQDTAVYRCPQLAQFICNETVIFFIDKEAQKNFWKYNDIKIFWMWSLDVSVSKAERKIGGSHAAFWVRVDQTVSIDEF